LPPRAARRGIDKQRDSLDGFQHTDDDEFDGCIEKPLEPRVHAPASISVSSVRPKLRCIVSTQVTSDQRAELERRARTADRSLSAEIRRAIARHLADHRHDEEDA
jgi:hypothetical protein